MTAFNTWAFPATGASCTICRTLPNRLADTRNVKDFGALGDGSHNDTTNIQAAIDAASTAGGLVFFPSGKYIITADLKNNTAGTNVGLIGTNRTGTTITGGDINQSTGFINYVENLTVDAVIMTGVTGGLVINCTMFGADLSGSTNVTMRNCNINGPGVNPGGLSSAAIGAYNGTNTSFLQCNWRGWPTALQLSGSGLFMSGCVTETCDICFLIGKDRSSSTVALENFTLCAHSTERSNTVFQIGSANNGYIGGMVLTGTIGTPGEGDVSVALSSVSWAASVVSVTTASAHGLSTGAALRLSQVVVGGSTSNGYNGNWVNITVTGASTFTFALAVNPGAATNPSGYWNMMQSRCIYFPAGAVVSNLSIYGITISTDTSTARIDMGSATSLTNVNFLNINQGNPNFNDMSYLRSPAALSPVPVSYVLPPDASKPYVTGVPKNMTFPFANLPASPVEGMEFSLNDANIGGKTWGDAITVGGSTGHTLVRRNASAWTYEGA